MRITHGGAAALALLVLAAAFGAAGSLQAQLDRPDAGARTSGDVRLLPFSPDTDVRVFPALDADGAPAGNASWRVLWNTGNVAESHLALGPGGRLYDLGGHLVRYSDDAGVTWTSVEYDPADDVVEYGGEGSLVVAPNGDVHAVAWVGPGERVIAIHYDAAEDAWATRLVPVHEPFYDRPWMGLLPGTAGPDGVLGEHASLLRGGVTTDQDLWLFSTDGLTYVPYEANARARVTTPVVQWLDVPARAHADWTQPIAHAKVSPLPDGGALVNLPGTLAFGACHWKLYQPTTQSWACFSLPSGRLPLGVLRVDAEGRVHHFSAFPGGVKHSVSADGGRSWNEHAVHYPAGVTPANIGQGFDATVSGRADVAALATVVHDAATGGERMLVVKWSNASRADADVRLHLLGDGTERIAGNNGQDGRRFDFPSVAVLPTGQVAASFPDPTHPSPYGVSALAIEQ